MLNYQKENQIISQPAKPRHILEEIVLHKQQEVNSMYDKLSFSDLKNQVNSAPQVRDFLAAIRQNQKKPSIIAEVKKASPSKGVIRDEFNTVEIALAYEIGGASCISVLTDQKFFQGSFQNLQLIRSQVNIPLLCKEFIIDPYQIYLARSQGADAILLIAAILEDNTIQDFLHLARSLGMTVLVEVHTLNELDRVLAIPGIKLVGINNRNLEDFSVDLATTEDLLLQRRERLHQLDITVVSESGLYASSDLAFVFQAGADAVLIGESLVKQDDIEQAIRQIQN
ncbi:indole-3-glycerol phosphate synthase [Calothrix sp. NIES-4101]|nr:indole-3-glycerol phosphate synthase [Calothrix sp. NIES-4101]